MPDRQLACAPVGSSEAIDYLAAMRAAANFAFANRQVLAHAAGQAFERVLGIGPRDSAWRASYDVAHNIAKEEEHEIDGVRGGCWCTARAPRGRFRTAGDRAGRQGRHS